MKIEAKRVETSLPKYIVFLKEKRVASKMTLEEVAKKVGVSCMAMSHYENGRRHPNMDRFTKWLKVFQLELTIKDR